MTTAPTPTGIGLRGLALAGRRTFAALFFVGLPALFVSISVIPRWHGYAYDFLIFRKAGLAYLHGHSPYPRPDVAVLAQQHSFVYPAPMAALFAPFSLLPPHVGSVLWGLVLLACVAGTLYLLDVRDPRVYAVSILWGPVFVGIRLGTVSPLLALLIAGLWRFRDRARPAALLLAAVIVAKVLLWPLALGLVATRRWRAAAGGLLLAAAVTLAAWSAIDFAGLWSYTHLLGLLTEAEQHEAFSVVSLALALGLSSSAAHVVAIALAASLLAGVGLTVLRIRRERADLNVFVLCVAAALVASPIVWQHYFALLLVPVAIVAPRFGPLWLLPLLLWLVTPQSHGHPFPILVAVVVPALVLVWVLGTRRTASRVDALPTIGLVVPAVHLARVERIAD